VPRNKDPQAEPKPGEPAPGEAKNGEDTSGPDALGAFLRTQRKLANLSLRELAALTDLSNAYLSQLERGLHQPSLRVLRSVTNALGLSLTSALAEAGLEEHETPSTVEAIAADPLLSREQKDALLNVYRSYLGATTRAG
jgi:transcriptional regulator with XRE-family HTH domain